ncbi:SRPBCC domain-containing protein [Pararhizobium sp. YC-54]|uniref:SRPBCC family protein n=1 Tax=Pararhizobium sp. YC-54 TaxID=2986920 RepID=UPI0021F7BAB0|nr:SRPBCC domain-containing protein [Pararhizobium sp. YC-54]MCW0000710.1 SRPBCC domain-containing protein [Pararhizobium sp. YC-54]
MTNHNFTTRFTVDQTPGAAFAAINNVRGWWSEAIDGPTDTAGGEFDYHFQDVHRCKIRVTELIPGKKVVWLVLDNYFSFTEDETEWTGTQIVFDISRSDDRTEVRLTHEGLVPDYECYDACSEGWSTYINESLRALIETGKGDPNVGDPMTKTERALAV